ncbi:hypothetical protein DNTS_025651 [Danionella cerebrum]|uniref:G-protein coupled receptors family 1 profile domain-containing protein n=1 Tax=Danionella cerebrum TaxID=2873325 RepID=A0A553MRL1_9TELE|nr:hypothetical protein DNTS_025651 [Danionella translucida]
MHSALDKMEEHTFFNHSYDDEATNMEDTYTVLEKITAVYQSVVICVSLSGNSLLLWGLLKKVKLSTSANHFLLHLIISNFIFTFTLIPWTVHSQNRNRVVCIMITAVGFFICLVPINIVIVLDFFSLVHFSDKWEINWMAVIYLFYLLGNTYCCINPLVRLFEDKRFRMYLRCTRGVHRQTLRNRSEDSEELELLLYQMDAVHQAGLAGPGVNREQIGEKHGVQITPEPAKNTSPTKPRLSRGAIEVSPAQFDEHHAVDLAQPLSLPLGGHVLAWLPPRNSPGLPGCSAFPAVSAGQSLKAVRCDDTDWQLGSGARGYQSSASHTWINYLHRNHQTIYTLTLQSLRSHGRSDSQGGVNVEPTLPVPCRNVYPVPRMRCSLTGKLQRARDSRAVRAVFDDATIDGKVVRKVTEPQRNLITFIHYPHSERRRNSPSVIRFISIQAMRVPTDTLLDGNQVFSPSAITSLTSVQSRSMNRQKVESWRTGASRWTGGREEHHEPKKQNGSSRTGGRRTDLWLLGSGVFPRAQAQCQPRANLPCKSALGFCSGVILWQPCTHHSQNALLPTLPLLLKASN